MANSVFSKAVGRGSIVLMARIVDSAGVAIRPSDVVAIEYSAYEVDAFWPEQRQVMRGHRAVPLVVRYALFDSPQVGCGWDVDDVGYNFRHVFRFEREHPFSNAEHGYEVMYQLTLCNGRRAGVRFRLRYVVPTNPLPGPPPKGEGV
jgi:hypothetical protein